MTSGLPSNKHADIARGVEAHDLRAVADHLANELRLSDPAPVSLQTQRHNLNLKQDLL